MFLVKMEIKFDQIIDEDAFQNDFEQSLSKPLKTIKEVLDFQFDSVSTRTRKGFLLLLYQKFIQKRKTH